MYTMFVVLTFWNFKMTICLCHWISPLVLRKNQENERKKNLQKHCLVQCSSNDTYKYPHHATNNWLGDIERWQPDSTDVQCKNK